MYKSYAIRSSFSEKEEIMLDKKRDGVDLKLFFCGYLLNCVVIRLLSAIFNWAAHAIEFDVHDDVFCVGMCRWHSHAHFTQCVIRFASGGGSMSVSRWFSFLFHFCLNCHLHAISCFFFVRCVRWKEIDVIVRVFALLIISIYYRHKKLWTNSSSAV